jgi:hypothetical protein
VTTDEPSFVNVNRRLTQHELDLGDNMLTALSVARDCDMIPDDAKIIAVEASESNPTPIFTYAQVYNRRVKEVRYDLHVCTSSFVVDDRRESDETNIVDVSPSCSSSHTV